MNKICILLCLVLLPLGTIGTAKKIDWAKLPSKTVLKAISRFKSDPLAAKADGILAIIVNFADKSPNVYVEIDVGYLPWIKQKRIKNSDILLAAFIAGNIRSQLISKKKIARWIA